MDSIWDFLDAIPRRGDVSPEELAARRQGYADLYASGFLSRNRDEDPMSVRAMEASQDFIPGIGDAIALGEAYDAASRGELAAAGLLGAGAVVGLVPGAGDMVARPIMAAGRKAADVARRIEVDPNALGSMGGNIRLRPADEVKPSAAEMRRQANIDRFGYDPNEAPAPSPNAGLLSDYVGEHRAPMRDGNAPAFNLAGDIYPDDIYSSKAVQYYGTGNQSMDRDTMGLLQSLRGKPDADVTIYRAVPKGVDDLNAGDWVTVNKQYAQDHGEGALGGDFDIVERKVKASEIFTNGDSIHEFGYDPLPSAPSLPAPRNEAEVMAKQVLEMRAAGNAGDVTDDMMALADDQYMFANTPLPMDEASRMARAGEMGFGKDLFHGGKGGYSYLSADGGTGKTSGTGAFLSPSNLLAETYSPVVDGAVYPVSSRSSAPIVSADMQNWNNIESPVYAYDPNTMEDIEIISDYGRASTDDIARNARGMAEAVEIQDVSDRGPRAWGVTQYPATSTVRVEYDPRNLRSRFARFDPEFRHLRNLSAGVGGLGLLSTLPQQEQQQGLLQ